MTKYRVEISFFEEHEIEATNEDEAVDKVWMKYVADKLPEIYVEEVEKDEN